MAGYSTRSLVDKLGMKPGQRAIILNPPPSYDATLGPLPEGIDLKRALRGEFDFLHAFFETRAAFDAKLPALKTALVKDGMLWISWRKGGPKAGTDLTENIVRDAALAIGLVDVKVAAIDDAWSGLKLMYRVRDR
jgi:hypothetical protein